MKINRRILGRNLEVPFFFQNDPPAGSGNNPPAPPNPPNPPKDEPTDVQKLIDAIVGSQRVAGNADEAYRVFAGQLIAKDKRISDLEAKAGQLPDDVKAELDAYRALGKPDELATVKERESTLSAEIAKRAKDETRDKAATVAGLDPQRVRFLQGIDELSFEVKSEERDGKPVDMAYAKYTDADGKEIERPLLEVVGERYAPLFDSLKAQPAKAPGTPFPPMNPGGNNGRVSTFDRVRQEVQAREKASAPQERDLKLAGIH